ncbi:MAG: LacI family transcriptional regulator [Propionibacteriaceae bacterium]|jgi:DNA-binding LacI/PurR family transcriptional regulator|nr:LacI family transcriptional regulator [Propionibacteriaceae bacterium]
MSNSQSVTMNDVARAAGVSLKTVSNVVNGYRYLRPETKAKVERAIEELGYRVNVTARNLRQGRTGLIKLVLPELRNPYFAELADSIVREASERGLRVLLEYPRYNLELELGVLRGDDGQQVDGVIFSPIYAGQDDAELFKTSFPLVILGESIFGAPCDHVSMRNIEGARAQAEHLMALGRRRIAIIGFDNMPAVSSSALRYKGVCAALRDAGLDVEPCLVAGPGPWLYPTGARLMGELLDSGAKPDGVVCFNDALGLGALRELVRRRIRVPEDIAIIGFDNVEEAQYSQPTLSSIDPGGAEIARTAVEMLVQRMGLTDDFDVTAPAREVLVDYQLVERESTVGVLA